MSSQTVRSLVSSDGIRLHFRHWPAIGTLQGIVVCLHGLQSHSRWYEYSSKRMADSGFEVYFADRRGSGLNGKLRGHADHGLRLLNDVRHLTRFARREHSIVDASDRSRIPVTLLGLSWGGKIAAAFAATYPGEIERLALLYPGLIPKLRPSAFQNFLLRFARRHDMRHKSIALPLDDPAMFTNNRDRQNSIVNDPLALHRVSSGLINSGLDLDQLITLGQGNIQHPLLLMLAGGDRIIDNAATRRRISDFPTDRLSLVNYPDACHTLEFEPNRENIFSDMIAWLAGKV